MDLGELGKGLILVALIIGLVGVLLLVGGKIPALGLLGHLPGDLTLGGDRFRIYIPLGTSILLSIVLTIALMLLARLFHQ